MCFQLYYCGLYFIHLKHSCYGELSTVALFIYLFFIHLFIAVECDDEGEAMMILSEYLSAITADKLRYGKRKSSITEESSTDNLEVSCSIKHLYVQILLLWF